MLATWGCSTFPKPTLSLDFLGATSLDAGITFTRGSQATLFDSTGTLRYAKHNLLLQSQTFQTSWATSTATVSADAGTAPDGTLTADKVIPDNAATGRVQQTFTTATGFTYTFSCFVKADGFGWVALGMSAPGAYFNLSGAGAVGTTPAGYTASITSVGSGWYRCVVTLTESGGAARTWRINPASADNTLAVGDGTSGILVWGAQLNLANMEGGVTSSLSTYYPTTTAAYYAPRFTYNPSTLAPQGLLIEEQRTNSIRNNTMQGAVAGTPGTAPTNWSGSNGGLTREIVGTGTANGITYIDVKWSGTTTSTFLATAFEPNNSVAATNAQAWTLSAYVAVVGGSTANITSAFLQLGQYSSVPAFLSNLNGSSLLSSLTGTLTRVSSTLTTNNASTAFVQPLIVLGFSSGVAIDITLRIGLPQLELGAFATSVIPTTTAAATRNADVASMTGTNFSSWFNASEGTLYTQYAALAAVLSQTAVCIDDGTSNNVITIRTSPSNLAFDRCQVTVSGVNQAALGGSGYVATNTNKIAFAFKLDDFARSRNGGAVVTDTSGTIPVVSQMFIGSERTSDRLNGTIARIAYYPTRLPNATLQALTV